MRICSFLPSATEIVYGLGLGDDLYGITYECDYPPDAATRPVVIKTRLHSGLRSRDIDAAVMDAFATGGSLYEIDVDVLRRAEPDLILTQELCDVCAISYRDVQQAIQTLPKEPRLISLKPHLLEDVFTDILTVGEATGRREAAVRWVADLRRRVEAVVTKTRTLDRRPRVVCLEWTDPVMASGHWMPELVELAGGVDPLGQKGAPSVRVDWDRVRASQPDVVILMPCGYSVQRTLEEVPLLERLDGWADLPAVKTGRVYAVNGHAYYSRSGPRLVDATEILAALLHPELFEITPSADAAARVY